jgi:hypothetical protein
MPYFLMQIQEKEMWETTPGLFTRSLEENTEGGSRVPLCIQRCWEAIEKRGDPILHLATVIIIYIMIFQGSRVKVSIASLGASRSPEN